MQSLVAQDQVTHLANENSREFLVFTLGDEQYGIDILKVQEIRAYEKITSIANTPDFIKGVMDLRGIIVPIVDLRIKFALESIEHDDQTVVIVVDVGSQVIGLVVDAVSDVMTFSAEEIKPAPTYSMSLSSDYIEGLASRDDQMTVLMDVEALLSSRELAMLDQTGG